MNPIRNLNKRSRNFNPWYSFIAHNFQLNREAAQMLLSICPPESPPFGSYVTLAKNNSGHPEQVILKAGNMMLSTQNYQFYGGAKPYQQVELSNGHGCSQVMSFILNYTNFIHQ